MIVESRSQGTLIDLCRNLCSVGVAAEQSEEKLDPAADAPTLDVTDQIDGASFLAEARSSRGLAGPFAHDGFQESFERLREQQQRDEPRRTPTGLENAQQALADPGNTDEAGANVAVREEGSFEGNGETTEVRCVSFVEEHLDREEAESGEGHRCGENAEQGADNVTVEDPAENEQSQLERLESSQVHQHLQQPSQREK